MIYPTAKQKREIKEVSNFPLYLNLRSKHFVNNCKNLAKLAKIIGKVTDNVNSNSENQGKTQSFKP